MAVSLSPLRYPGGKSKLCKYVANIVECNELNKFRFVEPFAGGASVSLFLLLNKYVPRILLNDYDVKIFSFWYSILNNTENFLKKMYETPISIEEWSKQKEINIQESDDTFAIGFSTFYLNRCNRSGIINSAGPIGGKNQLGNYKIDARFNKKKLEQKIVNIALQKNNIKITNFDFSAFMKKFGMNKKNFYFFDPPYYKQGNVLYNIKLNKQHHIQFSKIILNCSNPWIATYDEHETIIKLYENSDFAKLWLHNMQYSLQRYIRARELFITSKNILLPK